MMWIVLGTAAVLAVWLGLTWVICWSLESGEAAGRSGEAAGRSRATRLPLDAPERWEVYRAGLRTRAPYPWLLRKGYFIQRCYDEG